MRSLRSYNRSPHLFFLMHSVGCDCHFNSHPVREFSLLMCWKMVMHALKLMPDMADKLICGGEGSCVSQDVFQFNDAEKARALP